MLTKERDMQVLIRPNGTVMARNDEDNRYALMRNRAHALRIIRWLGLVGFRIREATDEEIAAGVYCRAHECPNWSTKSEPLDVPDGVATLS
jgi:hypothetical protein